MTQAAEKKPMRLSYTHEAMIDLILAEPTVTHAELAEVFGYSPGWIGRVVASDSFKARLAERKEKLIDPQLSATLNDRLRTVAVRSIDVLNERLSKEDASAKFALEALGVAATGLRRV